MLPGGYLESESTCYIIYIYIYKSTKIKIYVYIVYHINSVELTHYLESKIQAIWMQVWLDFTTSLSQTAL